MDLREIAELLTGPEPRVRLRQGKVTAVAANGTVSVQIAGSAATIAGVKCLASLCPVPGAGVWLASDGLDLFAIGTLIPTGPVYCSLQRDKDATIATGSWTDVSFATSTRTDPYGCWSAGAPYDLTIPVPGIYQIQAHAQWAADSNGGRDLHVQKNGSSNIVTDMRPPRPGVPTQHGAAATIALGAGDKLRLAVRQSSGGNLALQAGGADGIRLAACWLRPPT